MIRVVLDTNIVVSALLQPLGPSGHIFLFALGNSIQMCVSGGIYAEYEEVIRRPRLKRSPDIVDAALRAIRENAFWVRPAIALNVCTDPDDDIFLECAQASQADYLVTGNLRHFPSSWKCTRVVTPRWLLDTLISGTRDK